MVGLRPIIERLCDVVHEWCSSLAHVPTNRSFLEDTAAGLIDVMENHSSGLYYLGGNPGLTYYEIVIGLKGLLDRPWDVRLTTSFVYNNRLIDPRIQIPLISERLK